MINAEEQEGLFINIARNLDEKVEAFAIGGTAMIFLGLKEQTLDIDLVFSDEEKRRKFIDAAKLFGFDQMDSRIVYGQKRNKPIVLKSEESRIDLFVNEVISTKFSDEMKSRCRQTREFDRNLILKVADIHDILVMKCVTLREKDEKDILSILNNEKVDWDIIIKEAENQIDLGNDGAVLDIGTTLERMRKRHGDIIPKQVLDKLFNLLKKQIDKKAKMYK